MTDWRKIIILWAVVIVSYALVIVFTNPLVTLTEDQQHEVYEYMSYQLPPGDEACREGGNPKSSAFARTGEAFGLTRREVSIILDHGLENDWGVIHWCKER